MTFRAQLNKRIMASRRGVALGSSPASGDFPKESCRCSALRIGGNCQLAGSRTTLHQPNRPNRRHTGRKHWSSRVGGARPARPSSSRPSAFWPAWVVQFPLRSLRPWPPRLESRRQRAAPRSPPAARGRRPSFGVATVRTPAAGGCCTAVDGRHPKPCTIPKTWKTSLSGRKATRSDEIRH